MTKANTTKRLIEVGICSNELQTIIECMEIRAVELSEGEEAMGVHLQSAIDRGDDKAVDSLLKAIRNQRDEYMRVDAVRRELEGYGTHDVARIVVIDRDQTKIE